jgi:lipopolysaccharide transport system ATP-binding protein
MSVVIKFENVFKEYNLGVIGHGTLYRDLQSYLAKLRGLQDPNSIIGLEDNISRNSILALKDISLEIEQGEILGIIGLNGAGKSTLLKILSRVTTPTKGIIKVKGRMASLLEVGTGFHPELTGRENIFLNGTINGLTKSDIKNKLDEIVEFAEIEKFLDTPVKRYSSGMYVKLGFAVAAHLDPDILIIDEVLAVGDKSFREKAIKKINQVSKGEGRTVIFVSHNMQSIRSICTKTLYLENGANKLLGKTKYVIEQYLQNSNVNSINNDHKLNTKNRAGTGILKFTDIVLEDKNGIKLSEIISGESLVINLKYITSGFIDKFSFLLDMRIKDISGTELIALSSDEMGINFNDFKESGVIQIIFDKFNLRGGKYNFDIHSSLKINKRVHLDNLMNAFSIDVVPGDFYETGVINNTNSIFLLSSKIRNI